MLFRGNMYTERRVNNDFYATDPKAVKDLIELEDLRELTIFEPAAGLGHIANALIEADNIVITNDITNYGFNTTFNYDFLNHDFNLNADCIVMNPPFKYSKAFVLKALEISDKVYCFEKITFLEGIARYNELYSKGILEKVYIYSFRVACFRNGDEKDKLHMSYCWFVFNKNNNSKTQIEWITKGMRNKLN